MSSTIVVLACLAIIMIISLITFFIITGYCSNGQKVTVTPIVMKECPSIMDMDNIHTKQRNQGAQTNTNTISQTLKQSNVKQHNLKSPENPMNDKKAQIVSSNDDNITAQKQIKHNLKPSKDLKTNTLNPNAAEFRPHIASNTNKKQQIKQRTRTQKQLALPQQTDAKQLQHTQSKLHPSPTSTQQLTFKQQHKLDRNRLLRLQQQLKYQQCLNYYFFNDINI